MATSKGYVNDPIYHYEIIDYYFQANILVNESGCCCLADFGLSFVYESKTLATASREAVIGTVPWSAPELLNPEVPGPNTTASDVYALGCTMYEVSLAIIDFRIV